MDLPPETLGKLERLAAAGIEIESSQSFPRHLVLSRGGYAVLVEREGMTIGKAGSSGLVTAEGFAPLVWEGGRACFHNRKLHRAATDQEVSELRRFAQDVDAALG